MGTGIEHIQVDKRKLLAEMLGLMYALSFFDLECKAQDDINIVKEDIFEELTNLKGE